MAYRIFVQAPVPALRQAAADAYKENRHLATAFRKFG